LSPNKKAEVGFKGGARVSVAEVTWQLFWKLRCQIRPPLRSPPWQKIEPERNFRPCTRDALAGRMRKSVLRMEFGGSCDTQKAWCAFKK